MLFCNYHQVAEEVLAMKISLTPSEIQDLAKQIKQKEWLLDDLRLVGVGWLLETLDHTLIGEGLLHYLQHLRGSFVSEGATLLPAAALNVARHFYLCRATYPSVFSLIDRAPPQALHGRADEGLLRCGIDEMGKRDFDDGLHETSSRRLLSTLVEVIRSKALRSSAAEGRASSTGPRRPAARRPGRR